jgi:hypothetical protein
MLRLFGGTISKETDIFQQEWNHEVPKIIEKRQDATEKGLDDMNKHMSRK